MALWNSTTRSATRRHELTVSCKPPGDPTSQVGSATYRNDDPMNKNNTSQVGPAAYRSDTIDKGLYERGSTPIGKDYPVAASGHGCPWWAGLAVSQKDSNQRSTNTYSVEPNATAETGHDPDPTEPTPEVILETGMRLPPALVEIDRPTTSRVSPDTTGPTADERFHSELRTDTYLLYCEKPVSIPARNEVTIWVRVPIKLSRAPGTSNHRQSTSVRGVRHKQYNLLKHLLRR